MKTDYLMKKTIFLLRLEVHRSPGDFIEFPDGLVKVTSVSFLSFFCSGDNVSHQIRVIGMLLQCFHWHI